MRQVLIINGPNMNMLGQREPEKYGFDTLDEINEKIAEEATELEIECDFIQSNYEGEIVALIHNSEDYEAIVLNAAAYTHYSIAIRDAISSVSIPVVEIHMSNIYGREEFRQHSVLTPVCVGSIVGFGWKGYVLALSALVDIIDKRAVK